MARLEVTPTDALTGLPLPIVPVISPVNPDWHHHFHPRKSPILKQFGGPALRNARLQYVDYDTHHHGYHNIYEGPPLPETAKGRFAAVVMSVAGYVPEEGIAFHKDEPWIVRLTQSQQEYLQRTSVMSNNGELVIRRFLRDYLFQQDVADINVKESTIDEFVNTNNHARRRVLGHELLGLMTDLATVPIDETYFQARRNGLLLPQLPSNPRKFIKSKLGPMKFRDKITKDLRRHLATA